MTHSETLENMRARTGPVIGFFILSDQKLASSNTILEAFGIFENKSGLSGLPLVAKTRVLGVLSREIIENIPSIVGILSEKAETVMEKDYFRAEFDELACDVLLRLRALGETKIPGGLIVVNKNNAYAGFTSVEEFSRRMFALLKQRSPAERSKKQAGGVLC